MPKPTIPELLALVEQARASALAAREAVWPRMPEIEGLPPERRAEVHRAIWRGLGPSECPEPVVRRLGVAGERQTLLAAASFRESLTRRALVAAARPPVPEYALADKALAPEFASDLGLTRSEIIQSGVPFAAIRPGGGLVIKPAGASAGSRGVYLAFSETSLVALKDGAVMGSWAALEERVARDRAGGIVAGDRWNVERMEMDRADPSLPARDLKFYCFFGEIGLVLEVVRVPEVRFCWWWPDGNPAETGKETGRRFAGRGFDLARLPRVAEISRAIPAAFMRIDFLDAARGLVYGEFTPRPGNYHAFDDATDQRLGVLFLQAENRLFSALLGGERFEAFRRRFGARDAGDV